MIKVLMVLMIVSIGLQTQPAYARASDEKLSEFFKAAVLESDYSKVKSLLDSGEFSGDEVFKQHTLLGMALIPATKDQKKLQQSLRIAKLLIKWKPGIVNVNGSHGNPLSMAVGTKSLEAVRLLLEAGANPNVPTFNAANMIKYAEMNNARPEIIDLLKRAKEIRALALARNFVIRLKATKRFGKLRDTIDSCQGHTNVPIDVMKIINEYVPPLENELEGAEAKELMELEEKTSDSKELKSQ